jgi:UDP-N-acetylglucosamine--N-acetylmuramyl-(pentapeptide) pyrophosphoryl-undecaprenol N-acetylglucosamine transferase
MGGFASGPGGLASWLLRYPLCIHEQNAISGMTNRLLSRFASYRLEAFHGALPRATAEVGNPVRKDIVELPVPEQRYAEHEGPLRILVIGGSRGAAILNETVPQSLAFMVVAKDAHIWHQAGKGNRGIVQTRYSEQLAEQPGSLDERVKVSDFIDDMPAAYQWADMVICRAGALTVSELAAAGIASILIPFPYAVDDHQTANANYLADHKAALLLPQTELTPSYLAEKVDGLASRASCLEMAKKARERAKINATEDVANYCAKAAGVTLVEEQS